MTRQSKQKVCANVDRHCQSDLWRFCRNDSDSSLESSIVIRVESCGKKSDFSRLESPKIVTRVESLTRVTLSLLQQHPPLLKTKGNLS